MVAKDDQEEYDKLSSRQARPRRFVYLQLDDSNLVSLSIVK